MRLRLAQMQNNHVYSRKDGDSMPLGSWKRQARHGTDVVVCSHHWNRCVEIWTKKSASPNTVQPLFHLLLLYNQKSMFLTRLKPCHWNITMPLKVFFPKRGGFKVLSGNECIVPSKLATGSSLPSLLLSHLISPGRLICFPPLASRPGRSDGSCGKKKVNVPQCVPGSLFWGKRTELGLGKSENLV